MVSQKSDPPQIEVRENLGAKPNLALRSPLMFRVLAFAALVRKRESRAFRYLADVKSFRGLMQVDNRAASGLGDHLHRAIEDRVTLAQGGPKHVADQAM